MFNDLVVIGAKIAKVVLQDKMNQNSKDAMDEMLEKIDKLLKD